MGGQSNMGRNSMCFFTCISSHLICLTLKFIYQNSYVVDHLWMARVYALLLKNCLFQEMDNIPKPTTLTLDPNDENIILEIPDDRDPNDEQNETSDGHKKKVAKISTNTFWYERDWHLVVETQFTSLYFLFTGEKALYDFAW